MFLTLSFASSALMTLTERFRAEALPVSRTAFPFSRGVTFTSGTADLSGSVMYLAFTWRSGTIWTVRASPGVMLRSPFMTVLFTVGPEAAGTTFEYPPMFWIDKLFISSTESITSRASFSEMAFGETTETFPPTAGSTTIFSFSSSDMNLRNLPISRLLKFSCTLFDWRIWRAAATKFCSSSGASCAFAGTHKADEENINKRIKMKDNNLVLLNMSDLSPVAGMDYVYILRTYLCCVFLCLPASAVRLCIG